MTAVPGAGGWLRRLVRASTGRPAPLILMYHRVAHVAVDPWGLAVAPDVFARQMERVAATRTPVPLAWLADEVRAGRRPPGAVAVTFDDGYRDVLVHAKPVLDRLDIPATMFLTSGAFGSPAGFWWDRLASMVFGAADPTAAAQLSCLTSEPRRQVATAAASGDPRTLNLALWKELKVMAPAGREAALGELAERLDRQPVGDAPIMDRADVAALTSGGRITIGAHTVTHPSLPALAPDERRRELIQCRDDLEALTGAPVRGFAYPFGDSDPATARIVADAGFDHAVTTRPSALEGEAPPFALPRADVRNWSDGACLRFLTS